MEPDPILSVAPDFLLEVERLYASLLLSAQHQEAALGGKLLYAGELDREGRALLVAGNIAGVASLAATADPAAGKQAVRDGAADFLVSNLDEALRILKNEIRKREPVAVCVALVPQAVEHEMLVRGVLPDLLRNGTSGELSEFVRQGARPIETAALSVKQTLLTWRVAEQPAKWLPKLDALALDCLISGDGAAAHRWLRLAPRYLGRQANGVRVLRCDPGFAELFQARVFEQVDCGEIATGVEFQLASAPAASIRAHNSLIP